MIRLLKTLIASTVAGLFIWLCIYAWHTHPPVHRTVTEDEFIAQKLAEYDREDRAVACRPKTKMVFIWKDKKTAMIADALSLTPTSVDDTVDVRRMP
jgi:hypothetical protein